MFEAHSTVAQSQEKEASQIVYKPRDAISLTKGASWVVGFIIVSGMILQ